MSKMKDIPKVDQPREKMCLYGPNKLSNAELLAILIRTGTRNLNAIGASERILRRHGKDGIEKCSVQDLQNDFGIGTVKACQIVACFELGKRILKKKVSELTLSPRDVWKQCRDIRDNKKEHFVVFFLNARSQTIQRDTISVGTLTDNLVHPREVFEPAILHTAAQIIVAHNHPSGNPTPSRSDKAITQRLVEAGKILGIHLLDHVIVTKEEYVSLAAQGMCEIKE